MNMWRPQIFQCGLLLLVFVETYRDDACADRDLPASLKPSSEQCAVCLEEGCKTGVSRIILAKCDKTLWQKKKKIPECSVGNLKPDAPCMMSNGSLVLRTEQPLHFEDTDVGRTFRMDNMPCADLDLPPSLNLSVGAPDLNQINATTNSTTTPASAWPPWKIAITVCGSVAVIGVIAIVIYRRRHKRRREGQDGERPPDNNVEMDLLNRDDEHS
ncbi:uncharacterized protein LOC118213829 isoform X2 [Anguilla anguilla]|uniref:uncharacterized protein LOC118213829 isoform X2 n=1 Tax=Anguilla anguilla TaxID=7936 RepID=UPI0015B34C59|nr:uncharacterized protein LOC118213829 isoform X2 [Anguilla anguilla]